MSVLLVQFLELRDSSLSLAQTAPKRKKGANKLTPVQSFSSEARDGERSGFSGSDSSKKGKGRVEGRSVSTKKGKGRVEGSVSTKRGKGRQPQEVAPQVRNKVSWNGLIMRIVDCAC